MHSLGNQQTIYRLLRRHTLRHTEPDEVMQHIAAGESLNALLWFPHNRFFPDFTGAKGLLSSRDEPYVDMTMIFANEAITSNPELLAGVTAAIRHAWLALLESPPTVTAIATTLVDDVEFYTYLKRALGLHYAPDFLAATAMGSAPESQSPRRSAHIAARALMPTRL